MWKRSLRHRDWEEMAALEHWQTSYLFRMMKIFPSRQPFVELVPRTACQICFSSLSCLHTAVITHTYTHQHKLSISPQATTGVHLCDCVFFWKDRKAGIFSGHHYQHNTSGMNYLGPNRHMCTHNKWIYPHLFCVALLHSAITHTAYPVAEHYPIRKEKAWLILMLLAGSMLL